MNPYETNPVAGDLHSERPYRSPSRWRRWQVGFAVMCVAYYVTSMVTLPFADDVWLGEIPVLAVIQLPKAYFKSTTQDLMVSLLPHVGLASGSVSPDLILTDPWALGVTVVVPPLTVMYVLMLLRHVPRRRIILVLIVTAAITDAAVTFWFDSTSSLSVF